MYFPLFCLITTKIWSDISYSPWTDCVSALGQTVLQLRVTAQFYSENKRKIHPQSMSAYQLKWREGVRARERERERASEPQPFGSSIYIFFSLPLGLPYVNWASQESCLFYLRSSLWSLDLPLFYFCGLFPSLSFSHHHSGLLFLILTT